MPGSGSSEVDEIVLGHYGGGFSPQGFTSSLVLQADERLALQARDPGRERLRHRLGRDPPGAEVDRRAAGALRPGGRRREDDRPARARDRQGAAQRRLPQGGGRASRAASPACSARSPSATSSSMATRATRSPRSPPRTIRTAAPTRWRSCRKDLGFEFCRQVSDKNPLVAGPLKRTDCSLVSDGAAALVLTDVETALGMNEGGGVPRRGPGQRLPADEPARHHAVRGLRGSLAAKRLGKRSDRAGRPRLRRDPRLLHDRRAARVRGDGPDASAGRGRAPRSRAGPRRTAGCRSTPRAGSRPRATRSARPASRCTCSSAMQLTGTRRRDADPGRPARRHLQHGRRRGRQLRLDPRAAALVARPAQSCSPPSAAARLFRARVGVAAVFFLNGFGYGSWVPRIAEIQAKLGLSEGQLGLALLMAAVGALLAMPLAGAAAHRYGSRAVERARHGAASGSACPVSRWRPGCVGARAACCCCSAPCSRTMDVAMNAQGVAVERRLPPADHVLAARHVQPRRHGRRRRHRADRRRRDRAAAALRRHRRAGRGRSASPPAGRCCRAADEGGAPGPGFARPSRALLLPGLVALAGLLVRGRDRRLERGLSQHEPGRRHQHCRGRVRRVLARDGGRPLRRRPPGRCASAATWWSGPAARSRRPASA